MTSSLVIALIALALSLYACQNKTCVLLIVDNFFFKFIEMKNFQHFLLMKLDNY